MPRLVPLTERILVRLPGQRLAWIAAWALIPWLNASANVWLDTGGTSAVWEQRRLLIVLNYAAISLAVVLTLWGSERIARRVRSLRDATAHLVEGAANTSFREMNSVVGPLLASAATAFALGVVAFFREGWDAALLRGATWMLIGIPLWTFMWTYGSLHLGLNALGRGHLNRDAALVDPSLGLRPVGAVAFTGLWILLASLVPVLITALPDVTALVIGVLVVLIALAIFVLSLWGLHRQMVEVKEEEVAAARALYGQAYEPVRATRSLDALEQQRSLLSAADALETRTKAIHEWPIDEATWAWVIGIATSVLAITVGRVVVTTLGL
jgi:VIT1/CCC1 family predicted Fe2+/Mn2+ transporter